MNTSAAFWPVARKYFLSAGDMAVSLALIVLIAVADLVSPWLVMNAIDTILDTVAHSPAPAEIDAAFRKVLLLAGCMLASVSVASVTRYFLTKVQNKIIYRGAANVRDELFLRVQAQSLNFHNERRLGDTLARLVFDIKILQDALLELVFALPFDAVTAGGLVLAMFLINPLMGAIVTAFLFVVVVISIKMGSRGWHDQGQLLDNSAEVLATMQENLAGLRTFTAFGAGENERARIKTLHEKERRDQEGAGHVRAVVTPFFGFSEYAGIVLVLVSGGWCVLHGQGLTAGGFVAFLAYMEMAADPMLRGAQMLPKLQQARAAGRRVADLLHALEIKPEPPDAITLKSVAGKLNVRELAFTYPRAAAPALQGLDFSIEAGACVAVIGRNGAGKSTLLDLLLKLQDDYAGRIEIDGVDLRRVSPAAWRQFIGLLPQEVHLLNRSIRENIALGAANPQAVSEAAGKAGIDAMIQKLPHGYDTTPGERGVLLSGGQRQSIALARLFLRDARIILLDEPTSALDMQNEQELLPALRRLCAGRTTFLISHRPAVLNMAGKVLLLAGGKQLGFDTPQKIWHNHPDHRELFPPAWGALGT